MKSEQDYILLTYRSGIVPLKPTTYYTSDSGWGCMLRVLQMSLANLLYKQQGVDRKTIITLFWDNGHMPFSIQNITGLSQTLWKNKQKYEWYSPSEAGFLLKQLVEQNLGNYNVTIFNGNEMFLDEIIGHSKQKAKILVMIMARIGLDQPQQCYLPVIQQLMNSKYFYGIMGGTPKYAHLFLKTQKNMIGFLDPHQTTKAATTQKELLQSESEYVGKLNWIKINKIDSSMCVMFIMGNSEAGQFWSEMQSLKAKNKQNFFIYMQKTKPQFDEEEGGIIQINQDGF